MAQDGISSVVKWGLLIGGAYLLYENFLAAPAAAVAASGAAPAPAPAPGGGTPAPAPAAAPPLPAGITPADLLTALGATDPNSTFNLDQWSYAVQNVPAKSFTITPAQMGAIIAAAGGNRAAMVNASEYLAALHTAGLSGLDAGARRRLRVPIVAVRMPDGRVRVTAVTPSGMKVYMRST